MTSVKLIITGSPATNSVYRLCLFRSRRRMPCRAVGRGELMLLCLNHMEGSRPHPRPSNENWVGSRFRRARGNSGRGMAGDVHGKTKDEQCGAWRNLVSCKHKSGPALVRQALRAEGLQRQRRNLAEVDQQLGLYRSGLVTERALIIGHALSHACGVEHMEA